MTQLSLTVERTFAIDRETLWRLWTSPEHASLWMRPSRTDYGPTAVTMDARPGGKYRMALDAPGSAMTVISGEYLEVDAPSKLVYTWAWDDSSEATLVEVRFDDVDGGTRVHIVHSQLKSPESVTAHQQGWIGCLSTLAEVFEPAETR